MNQNYRINIICIQETWLRPQWDFMIRDSTAVRNDREYGRGAGIATSVCDWMKFKICKLQK